MASQINNIRIFMTIAFLAFTLPGCANLDTVREESVDRDSVRVFNENLDKTKAATLTSLQSLNIHVKDVTPIEDGVKIMFTKAISAFSWGEVGRVMVVKVVDNQTEVRVRSQKRSTMQITGTDQKTFAHKIFEGIEQALE